MQRLLKKDLDIGFVSLTHIIQLSKQLRNAETSRTDIVCEQVCLHCYMQYCILKLEIFISYVSFYPLILPPVLLL